MKKIKAVMMAGGFGTRIQPLTHSTPKPMLPITNIPMMEHILIKLKQSGIDEVVILLYYMPEVIKNHFKDGSKWGVKIDYVLPDGDYGTAGAVGFAREFLDTTFMIVSGDLVTDFDFKKIIENHFRKKAKLSITLTSVENPLQFGIVIVDENGKIEKFLEKPSWGEVFSDTINTGIYLIEPEILDYIPKDEVFDFAKDLFPLLMERGIDLYGFVAKGYWRDVGNPDSYREVHEDILHKKLDFQIPGIKIEYPEGTLYLTGKSDIPESVEIIDTVVIGDNVSLQNGIKLHNTVIGDNTVIGKDTKLKNSVIWKNVRIGKKCVLDNAVICDNCEIGDLVSAKAGIILAQDCKVGKLADIERDVIIWPSKEIEPASIVTNNIIWGTKYKNALFNNGIISGTTNIEISCDMACKIGEAFASQLPQNTKVLIGRDFENGPRMIKRAFAGGVLSTGVDIIDLKAVSPSMLRLSILENEDIKGGAYFRKSLLDPSMTEIILFNSEGLRLHNEIVKKIEKSFFKEDFRRIDYKEIGKIYDDKSYYKNSKKEYISKIHKLIDHKLIKSNEFKVAIDLMWGITKDLYTEILKFLQINNILLNAYYDNIKISNLNHFSKESKKDMSTIVKCLDFDAGFSIYPQGQRLSIISNNGEIFDKTDALSTVLYLFDLEAKSNNKTYKVFLPTWAPDLMDEKFKHLKIKRGKYSNFKTQTFKNYDLIATIDGNFAFTEFALHRDAIYSSLKIMEMLSRHNIKLSEIEKDLTPFFYKTYQIACPQNKKGKIMRKAASLLKDKHCQISEGVKICENGNEWILIIPDQYSENVNIYIQAENKKNGGRYYKQYSDLIKEWIEE